MLARHSIVKAVVVAFLPGALLAQAFRGTVTEQSAKAVVPGAVIALLDSVGATVGRALTGERGEFAMSAPKSGTYRLRTMRIGFRPFTSAPIRIGDEVRDVSLEIISLPVSLDTVRVASRNACREKGDTVVATYAIWEQVRTALAAAQLTAASTDLTVSTMTYERTLDAGFRKVVKQKTAFGRSISDRPWRSLRADSLRKVGYVVLDPNGLKIYMAPDIDVLLSDEFLDDHCLRIASGPADAVGIAFEPNRDRADLPEIRGVVWLDRASAEVRNVDYNYVNLTIAEKEAQPGGQMQFMRLKSGEWVIVRWSIRMPIVSVVPERVAGISGTFTQTVARVNEIRVAGGELVSILKGLDTTWAREPYMMSGTVQDSLSRDYLRGATVSVQGSELSAVTDKDGKFSIKDVLPGEYTLEVRTPSLDSVGGLHLQQASVTEANTKLKLNVPSGDDFALRFCPSAADSSKPSALLIGTVRIEGDTSPPWGVSVVAQWKDGKETRAVDGRTDGLGRYRMCGLPLNRDIAIRSELDDTASVALTRRAGARKRFIAADILVRRPAAVVGALFAGTVVSQYSGDPIAEAEVLIEDLQVSVRTNAQGRFRIAGIAPGTHKVSARKVGWAARDLDVKFEGTSPVTREFRLGGVAALDPVTVKERPLLPDFEEHRRLGAGKFIARDELAKMEGLYMSHILRMQSSVDIFPGKTNENYPRSERVPRQTGPSREGPPPNEDNIYCITEFRCQCFAQVYVDKMLMNPGRPTPAFNVDNLLRPEQVEAVEWYASQAGLPMEYARRGATCGVLVIHTRKSKL